MTYVYIDPSVYVEGKGISFEEYAQLVENANQAFTKAQSNAAIRNLLAGASEAWTNTTGATVSFLVTGCGGGGGGSKGGSDNFGSSLPGNEGADGGNARMCSALVSVPNGVTATFTAGQGGTRGTGGGSPPGNPTDSTIVLSNGDSVTFKAGGSANGVTPGSLGAVPAKSGSSGQLLSAITITPAQGLNLAGVGGRGYDSGIESEDGGPGQLTITRLSASL